MTTCLSTDQEKEGGSDQRLHGMYCTFCRKLYLGLPRTAYVEKTHKKVENRTLFAACSYIFVFVKGVKQSHIPHKTGRPPPYLGSRSRPSCSPNRSTRRTTRSSHCATRSGRWCGSSNHRSDPSRGHGRFPGRPMVGGSCSAARPAP